MSKEIVYDYKNEIDSVINCNNIEELILLLELLKPAATKEFIKGNSIIYLLIIGKITLTEFEDQQIKKYYLTETFRHYHSSIPQNHYYADWSNYFPGSLIIKWAVVWHEAEIDYSVLFYRIKRFKKDWLIDLDLENENILNTILQCAHHLKFQSEKTKLLGFLGTKLHEINNINLSDVYMAEGLGIAENIEDPYHKQIALQSLLIEFGYQNKINQQNNIENLLQELGNNFYNPYDNEVQENENLINNINELDDEITRTDFDSNIFLSCIYTLQKICLLEKNNPLINNEKIKIISQTNDILIKLGLYFTAYNLTRDLPISVKKYKNKIYSIIAIKLAEDNNLKLSFIILDAITSMNLKIKTIINIIKYCDENIIRYILKKYESEIELINNINDRSYCYYNVIKAYLEIKDFEYAFSLKNKIVTIFWIRKFNLDIYPYYAQNEELNIMLFNINNINNIDRFNVISSIIYILFINGEFDKAVNLYQHYSPVYNFDKTMYHLSIELTKKEMFEMSNYCYMLIQNHHLRVKSIQNTYIEQSVINSDINILDDILKFYTGRKKNYLLIHISESLTRRGNFVAAQHFYRHIDNEDLLKKCMINLAKIECDRIGIIQALNQLNQVDEFSDLKYYLIGLAECLKLKEFEFDIYDTLINCQYIDKRSLEIINLKYGLYQFLYQCDKLFLINNFRYLIKYDITNIILLVNELRLGDEIQNFTNLFINQNNNIENRFIFIPKKFKEIISYGFASEVDLL